MSEASEWISWKYAAIVCTRVMTSRLCLWDYQSCNATSNCKYYSRCNVIRPPRIVASACCLLIVCDARDRQNCRIYKWRPQCELFPVARASNDRSIPRQRRLIVRRISSIRGMFACRLVTRGLKGKHAVTRVEIILEKWNVGSIACSSPPRFSSQSSANIIGYCNNIIISLRAFVVLQSEKLKLNF